MKQISVAIVGVGAISELIHIPTLSRFKNVRIEKLVDPYADPDRLDRLSKTLECTWSRSIEDLKVDLAVVAVPISMHYQLSMDLLKKGIHLLVEKPLVPTLEQANRVIALAQESSVRVFCGQVRRFYENVETTKNAISSGMIGELERVSIFEGNLYGWKRNYFKKEKSKDTSIDEGVLFDVGCHGIDSVLYVLESEFPEIHVSTCLTDDTDRQTNVQVEGVVEFRNRNRQSEFRASFSNSMALANCIWFRGSTGTIMLSPNPTAMPRFFPRKGGEMLILDKVTHNATPVFVQQYNEVIEGIMTEKKTRIDAQNVLATVSALGTIWANLKEGKCPWLVI